MVISIILILNFGINVSATSSTTYESRTPYLFYHDNVNDAIAGIDPSVLINRYINIPLRVANYCNNMPGNNNGSCPSYYDSSKIGMVGLSNSTGTNAISSSAYVDLVDSQWKNGSNSYFQYSTANSNSSQKVKYGYFNSSNDYNSYSQTHKQNVYYIDDTHGNYPYRTRIRSRVALDTDSSNKSVGFDVGNIIMYKMSYMLGPSNGNYGDGTWSETAPAYEPDGCPGCYGNVFENAFNSVERTSTMWFDSAYSSNYDNYDWNNKLFHKQNNDFGAMFDGMEQYPGCYDGELCGSTNTFQGSSPMLQFLSLYEHTLYDKTSNTAYNKKTTLPNGLTGANNIQWMSNSYVFGQMFLQNGENVVGTLSTSTVIQATPYNYVYTDNGTKYYSTIWLLDIYFFGYIDDDYDFNKILVSFHVDNQLSTYGSIKQLDLFVPGTGVMVIGDVNVISEITGAFHQDVINLAKSIPVIGPILAIILEILFWSFGFILQFIYLFDSVPSWIKGGLICLFICLVVRIIYKIVRGG